MIRARTGAAFAAVALVAVSVFGGVTVAYADPPTTVTIDNINPDEYIPGDGTGDPAIGDMHDAVQVGTPEGTATAVSVSVAHASDAPTSYPCTTTDSYTWTCAVDGLHYGLSHVTATASNSEGSADSAAVPFSFYSLDGTITLDNEGTTIFSNAAAVTISGTGPALGSIHIATEIDVAVHDNGRWSYTFDPLDEDEYDLVITSTVGAEGSGSSKAFNFLVEETPPAPKISKPALSSSTYDPRPTFEGVVESPPSNERPLVVVVQDASGILAECPVDPDDNSYSCTAASDLSIGANDIWATTNYDDYASYPDVDFEGYPDPTHPNPSEQSNHVTVNYSVLGPPTTVYDRYPGGATITASGNADTVVGYTIGEAHDSEGFFDGCPFAGEGEFSGTRGQAQTCSWDLDPGDYYISAAQTPDFYRYVGEDDYLRIPDAPALGSRLEDNRTITLYGTSPGPDNDVVIVQTIGGTDVCQELVEAGTWSCNVPATAGARTYRATEHSEGFNPGSFAESYDKAIDGYSAWSNSSTLSVPALVVPVVPTPTPTPTPTGTPPPPFTPPWSPTDFVWTFAANADGYHPGDPVTLTGEGLPSGALVDAELHSTPVELGRTIARSNGTFILNVVIPADTEPGIHHFSVTITPIGGGPSTILQPAMITVVDTGQAKPSGDGGAVPGAVGDDRNDPGAPSSFTHGISTLRHMIANPVVLAIAGGIGLALLLLVAFPAELLNSTIESQYDRFAKVIPKVRAPWYTRLHEWIDRTPIVGGSLLILVASVIFGFADPGFGFDITSLRLVLACFIALFIVGYLAGVISARILGRAWSLDTIMEIKPLGLILTIVGVVISRLIDFSPGFLVGLLLGIALVGKPSKKDEARSTLVQSGVVLALALLAWLAYSGLSALFVPTDFAGTLLFDTLVAVTTEGLTGLFIGLLPLRFLDGQSLFQYSRPMWAAVYAVVAFAFVAVVIPAADNWGDGGGSIVVWMSIVGAFAVVAVGIYLYFRFWAPPLAEEGPEEGHSPAEEQGVTDDKAPELVSSN